MRERNPFFIKSYEGTESDREYLQYFNAEALRPIDDKFLDGMKYINSSPGAGKTSIFKAFSPSVMRLVLKNAGDLYKELYQYLEERHIISNKEIRLLSCYISCARNYDSIEDDFTNGKRKQVFFALMNTKIIIACLRALCEIKDLSLDDDLKRITFTQIPDEMLAQKEKFSNGSTLFEWACETESELCRYLDDYDEEPLPVSFIHTTLLCTKLFEPACIKLDGKRCIDRTLFIFDDFHKLTELQREYLTEAFMVLRVKAGVWFGQRFVGLPIGNILTSDGMVGREYSADKELNLEYYWSSSKNYYNKLVEKIADQRLHGLSGMPGTYEDLIEGKLSLEEYEAEITKGINKLVFAIESETAGMIKYKEIFLNIKNGKEKGLNLANRLQVLLMLIRRDQRGQMELDLEPMQQEEYESAYRDSKTVAEYYFLTDNDIPYYYGMNVLKRISSYNIEQFLSFAGSVFELNKAGKIIDGKNFIRVSAKEQEQLFMSLAQKRWDDILQRFTMGEQIQNMLVNLCEEARGERDKESNSYEGGAFTGIGIELSQVKRITEENRYKQLCEVLRQCISAGYFEKKISNQGNKEWLVLYYNRWICLQFKLPLGYGGWMRIHVDKLNECITKKRVQLQEDYDYTMVLIGE